jgi:hypothetical protein
VALEVVLVLSIVVPLAVLAVVCWVFWKAAQRDAAAARSGGDGAAAVHEDVVQRRAEADGEGTGQHG